MALPTYPTTLPYVPLQDPYQVSQRHPALTVTEMEDGPKRQRASASGDWSQHVYQIVLTEAEFQAFDSFVQDTLVRGASRFWMPVGRFSQPRPWGLKMVYLEGGAFTVKYFATGYVSVSFTLNVLSW